MLYHQLAEERIRQRCRDRTQCSFTQDEPVEPAIPDKETKRFPKDRRVCRKIQRCGWTGL